MLETYKVYEFDGTDEGVRLINERLYSKPFKDGSIFRTFLVNGKVILRDGRILQKGDHYDVRLPETFNAIG